MLSVDILLFEALAVSYREIDIFIEPHILVKTNKATDKITSKMSKSLQMLFTTRSRMSLLSINLKKKKRFPQLQSSTNNKKIQC